MGAPFITPDPDRVLTVTAGTADQATPEMALAPGYAGILLTLQVTAGTTLLLDMNLQFRNSAGTWVTMVADMPSAGGITGVSTTHRLIYPHAVSGASLTVGLTQVPIPHVFRILVNHGNANAATYTLDVQAVN